MPKVEPILSNTVSRLDCVEENVFLEIVGTLWIGHLLEETRVSISWKVWICNKLESEGIWGACYFITIILSILGKLIVSISEHEVSGLSHPTTTCHWSAFTAVDILSINISIVTWTSVASVAWLFKVWQVAEEIFTEEVPSLILILDVESNHTKLVGWLNTVSQKFEGNAWICLLRYSIDV